MTEAGVNILAVDDDPHILEIIEFALTAAGFKVNSASDGEAALAKFKASPSDLLILDINLPQQDGLWVCQQIRTFSQVPIIFLSARDEEVDRVMGLTIGGDDYVTKPFSPRELVARVRAILRRQAAPAGQNEASSNVKKRGLLTLELDSYSALWGDHKLELTITEFNILQYLINRPKKTFSRDELLNLVYQDAVVSDRTIDSHILHIRKKFAAVGAGEIIQTQHGIGYKLADTLDN